MPKTEFERWVKLCANWVINDVARLRRKYRLTITEFRRRVPAGALALLLLLVFEGKLQRKPAQEVLEEWTTAN